MKRSVKLITTVLMALVLATNALAYEGEDTEISAGDGSEAIAAHSGLKEAGSQTYGGMGNGDMAEIINRQYSSLELDNLRDSLPESGAEIMGELEISSHMDMDTGLGKIYEKGCREIGGILKGALRSAVIILIIAIVCSVSESFFESGAFGEAPSYISFASVLAISIVAVGDVNAFIGYGYTTLDELNGISKVLLPTLSAAAAAGGAVTSAAVKYAATALFMDVLITLATGLLMPVIYAYIASSIAEAAIGGEGLSGASGFLKWLATTILTLLVLSFVVYISVTGIVSSTADAATIRVAKTALSTVFPVVGSIISDAASSVLAGASVLKNAIGVFGMLAVIAICLLPFLNLGAHYILYKAASKLSATISGARISKLVSSIGTAFGLVMSLTGACALMLFFSIISMLKVVSAQ